MKIRRSGVFLSILFFLSVVYLNPAAAKIMTVEDFSGTYYGARIKSDMGVFNTALYEITADGTGGVSFTTIAGWLGPLTTTYAIDSRGMLTAESGVINGAVSPDGMYVAIGKFTDLQPPQLLFAIKKSSDLTNAVIAGNYHIYLLYEMPRDGGGLIFGSNPGNFQAADGDVLSGSFSGAETEYAFAGDYTVDYDVAPDGRLALTFVDGQNAAELGPMQGVVSPDGNIFVAVDTTEEGARAYALGIRRSDFTPEDLAGKFHVTDFGYFDLDNNTIQDDAVGSVMDFEAAADGTLSFLEPVSTHEPYPAETEVTGTFTMDADYQFLTVFDNYPCGLKTGGAIQLSPQGGMFSLVGPTYLGIGIAQASGVPDPVTELTANAGVNTVVEEGTLVTLDGSGSAAPEGDIQSYSWSQTEGPTVELVHPQSVQTEFTAPDVDATIRLIFELTVSDVDGNTDTDSVTITINDTSGSARNQAPTADAGISRTVCENQPVILDGTRSTDPDGQIVSYSWTQTAGEPVVLTDVDVTDARATFTAPAVEEQITLTFQLEVTDDGGLSDAQTVDITVEPDKNGNGMPDAMESRDSDIDGDGTPDFDDPDSISFRLFDSDQFIGIHTSKGTLVKVLSLAGTDASLAHANRPKGTLPYGAFSFQITGLENGDTVDVTFILPEELPEDAGFYKFDEIGGWKKLEYIRGEQGNSLTVSMTDGDLLTDEDGAANGTIVDPSAVVLAQEDGSGGNGGGSCFIKALLP